MSGAKVLVRILSVLTLFLVASFPYINNQGFLLPDVQGFILLLLLVGVLLTNLGIFSRIYNASNKKRAWTLGISGFVGGLAFGVVLLGGTYGALLIPLVGIFGIAASYLFALIVNQVLDKHPKSFSAVLAVVIVAIIVPLMASITYAHRALPLVHPERAAEQLCTRTGTRINVSSEGQFSGDPFLESRYKNPLDQTFCNFVYQTVHQPITAKFETLKGTTKLDSWCNSFNTLDSIGIASTGGFTVSTEQLVAKCRLLNSTGAEVIPNGNVGDSATPASNIPHVQLAEQIFANQLTAPANLPETDWNIQLNPALPTGVVPFQDAELGITRMSVPYNSTWQIAPFSTDYKILSGQLRNGTVFFGPPIASQCSGRFVSNCRSGDVYVSPADDTSISSSSTQINIAGRRVSRDETLSHIIYTFTTAEHGYEFQIRKQQTVLPIDLEDVLVRKMIETMEVVGE